MDGNDKPKVERHSYEPVDTTGQRVTVENCPSCDCKHEKQPIKPFWKDNAPWTHWFSCPNTGDPVPMSLVMRTNSEGIKLSQLACEMLTQAEPTRSWMMAVWRIEHGKVHCRRITQTFPKGDFGTALQLLRKDLEEESGPQQQEPMKNAPELPPAVNLFGE